MKRQVSEWIVFSKTDLDSAMKLMEEPRLSQNSAFHCQQAIEKAFKAVIDNNSSKVPRTHDLRTLLGIINTYGISMEIEEDVLDEINAVCIETGYPRRFPDCLQNAKVAIVFLCIHVYVIGGQTKMIMEVCNVENCHT